MVVKKKKKVTSPSAQAKYFGRWWDKHGSEHLSQERNARRQRRLESVIPLLKKEREKIWKEANSNSKTSVLPKRVTLGVPTGDGVTARDITFYPINVLASLVGRNTQTVRVWEKQKFMPTTPYRDRYGRRMYSRQMMEAVCKAFDNDGGWLRRESFYPQVNEAWKKLGFLEK